jgi:hypothetical protein
VASSPEVADPVVNGTVLAGMRRGSGNYGKRRDYGLR